MAHFLFFSKYICRISFVLHVSLARWKFPRPPATGRRQRSWRRRSSGWSRPSRPRSRRRCNPVSDPLQPTGRDGCDRTKKEWSCPLKMFNTTWIKVAGPKHQIFDRFTTASSYSLDFLCSWFSAPHGTGGAPPRLMIPPLFRGTRSGCWFPCLTRPTAWKRPRLPRLHVPGRRGGAGSPLGPSQRRRSRRCGGG